jgi:galactokinase
MDEGIQLKGADILIQGDIPLGGGLSSSASLETVLAYALLDNIQLELSRSQLALWCQRAENEFVGVACGIMDQFVISLSRHNEAMKLDCRWLEYEQVKIPRDVLLLVVDCGVKHQLSDGGFNALRMDCEQAARLVNQACGNIRALRDVSTDQLVKARELMDNRVYRRARHVVSEIQRVRDAHIALQLSDHLALGTILDASHASLRDDFGVSCDELDALTGIARACDGVYGSRMVGAGFGGCTISLVDANSIGQVTDTICHEYGSLLGSKPWWHVVSPSDPVGRVSPE